MITQPTTYQNDTPVSTKVSQQWPMRAAFAGLAYLAYDCLLPLVPISPAHLHQWQMITLLIGSTLAFFLLQLWLPRAIITMEWSIAKSFQGAAVAGAFFFASAYLLRPHLGMNRPEVIAVILLGAGMKGLTLTVALTFLGSLLSLIIREAKLLLPIALVSMAIDVLGAMTKEGFTANAIAHHPEVVHAVSVPMPSIGGLHPISYIGPGDALFIGFFFGIVQRMRLNMPGTFWTMFSLLSVAMLIVLATPWNVAALLPMGIAVIATNIRHFKFDRSEVFAMIYTGVIAVAAAAGFFLFTNKHLFHGH